MIGCRSARELLSTRTLARTASAAPELTEARRHVAACAACRGCLARFVRAIMSSDPDEVTCAEARARLDVLHPLSVAGEAPAALRRHVRSCPACATQMRAWQGVMALQEQGALVEPARYPDFDLSFLHHLAPAAVWTQVRNGLRRLSYDIPAALALAGRALLSPPPGLAVSYATVQAARRARAKGSEKLVSLSVDDQQQDVRISLNVTSAEKALWLAVTMRLLSSGQVLTGARIALCNEQGQAQEIKTVRSGENEARFPDITPGRYLVRVERSGKTWELPLSL